MRLSLSNHEFIMRERTCKSSRCCVWDCVAGCLCWKQFLKTGGPSDSGMYPSLFEGDGAVVSMAFYARSAPNAADTKDALTYVKTQQANGTWKLKLNARTGEVLSRNDLVPMPIIELYERLWQQYGRHEFCAPMSTCRSARNHAHRRIEEIIVKRFCPCVQSCIGCGVPSIGQETGRAQRVPYTIRWWGRDSITGTLNPTQERTDSTRGA